MMQKKLKLQADQYAFPYHYLVDLQAREFGRNLDWGLDYYTYMRKVLSLVKRYLTTDVLDVGCGDGFLLNHLARDLEVPIETTMVGIDLDEKPIKFARAFAHGLPNLTFHAQDIATFEDSFHLITCVETFEHIPDNFIDPFIANIDRLLRSEGILIISVPSKVRAVIEKHYRHYDLAMLRAYFPEYDMLEEHYVSARKNLLYQVVALLLSNRRFNLNFGIFKRVLLKLHERFTSDVSEERGAHIVVVLRKP